MGCIIGHRIDYDGERILRGQQNLTHKPPRPQKWVNARGFGKVNLFHLSWIPPKVCTQQ